MITLRIARKNSHPFVANPPKDLILSKKERPTQSRKLPLPWRSTLQQLIKTRPKLTLPLLSIEDRNHTKLALRHVDAYAQYSGNRKDPRVFLIRHLPSKSLEEWRYHKVGVSREIAGFNYKKKSSKYTVQWKLNSDAPRNHNALDALQKPCTAVFAPKGSTPQEYTSGSFPSTFETQIYASFDQCRRG